MKSYHKDGGSASTRIADLISMLAGSYCGIPGFRCDVVATQSGNAPQRNCQLRAIRILMTQCLAVIACGHIHKYNESSGE